MREKLYEVKKKKRKKKKKKKKKKRKKKTVSYTHLTLPTTPYV